MIWTDLPSLTSTKPDGSKVGGFMVNGRLEFWGYPTSACPTGPHATCEEAKAAVDAALPLEFENDQPLIYRTKYGSTVTIRDHKATIEFDWFEEHGACCDCCLDPDASRATGWKRLIWFCGDPECGGGSADLVRG